MTHSYIVAGNTLIARIPARHSGEVVKFASTASAEALNANRDKNLVNARSGMVSNAKKWVVVYAKTEKVTSAIEINPGEFLLS